MKEIPVTLIKANQTLLVTLTLAAIVFQNVWIVAMTFILTSLSLLFGPKANVAFRLAKLLIKKDLSKDETEAAVLQQFNQRIATSLLGIALIILITTGHWIAWIFVGMVTTAATVALLGFCVGCFLYFQFKKLSYRLKTK
ncbi:DUF4395 domain-containing protein [Halalkalibacterium ligniniphilum]|uniref:DUF4395 domain-containing protein n=1 Tax=Halalkalibacterium ligniniphilum TaxID=1134413 RepID=UPI00034A2A68|nr:DUF4395 domain-containing protein [Halalkalibacterium ligniniphilum]